MGFSFAVMRSLIVTWRRSNISHLTCKSDVGSECKRLIATVYDLNNQRFEQSAHRVLLQLSFDACI